jgi:hypothetical protein
LSGVQHVDQRLGLFQIERVEAFSEPVIDRSEEIRPAPSQIIKSRAKSVNGMGPAVLLPRQRSKLGRGAKDKEHAMSQTLNAEISAVGIDIGKNSFHIIGHDERGAIVLRQRWSRGQVEARFANMPPCLIGMEACVGAHYLSRKLKALGHDARLMPAKYVRPYPPRSARG